MNLLFHLLFAYLIVSLSLGTADKYLVPLMVSSVILDLDHLPYLLRMREKVLKRKFGAGSRSWLHEIGGLAAISLALCLAALSNSFEIDLIKTVALSFILHYAADFLFGRTRPFYPFDKTEIRLGLVPERSKVRFEIIATILMGAGVLWMKTGR